MRVIFLKDIAGTARAGEVREVSDGYARNFLLPKKLAEPATEQRLQEARTVEKRRSAENEMRSQEYSRLAQKLTGAVLEFTRKADKSGTIFGSVSADNIAEEIYIRTKIKIPRGAVNLPHALKKAGEYQVELDLGNGLKSKVKVTVKGV